MLIIIRGPTCAGKTTIARRVVTDNPWLTPIHKATTRRRRPGESDGDGLVFVDEQAFNGMRRRGEIVVPYRRHGAWYGFLAHPTGRARRDSGQRVAGIEALRWSDGIAVTQDTHAVPAALSRMWPNTIIIVLDADLPILEQRLRARNVTDEEKRIRLASLRDEFTDGCPVNVPLCHYRVSCADPIERVHERVLRIIEHDRARRRSREGVRGRHPQRLPASRGEAPPHLLHPVARRAGAIRPPDSPLNP